MRWCSRTGAGGTVQNKRPVRGTGLGVSALILVGAAVGAAVLAVGTAVLAAVLVAALVAALILLLILLAHGGRPPFPVLRLYCARRGRKYAKKEKNNCKILLDNGDHI